VHKTFDEIFEDFAIALYYDDVSWAGGKYGFFALDIPSENSYGMSIPLAMELWDSWYPDTGYFEWFVDEYPHDGSYILVGRGLPYTVNYVRFTESPLLFEVEFNGDDTCGAAPTSGTHNWYSDGEAWSWFTLSQTFDIPDTGATLNFANYFSIEADWDYGFVEVYDYDTGVWSTLPGLGTIDYIAHEQDNPNTPDEREPTAYEAAGTWNAFTGESGGIYTEVMDLSAFAGKTIELSFTYWTDPYTLASGWYIDDIEIPEIGFYDDCETEGGWTVNTGWYLNDEIIFNDFEVNFVVGITILDKYGDPDFTYHYKTSMRLNDDTEEGSKFLITPHGKYMSSEVVMVVTNQPGYEHTFGTGYTYSADEWVPSYWWWRYRR
jgi:bacillopeptidase F (M6 metalloprotease family)